jgi:hypothetical protein
VTRVDDRLLLLAMLHEGGWDEILMVGAGLILAYVIIMATGRKPRDAEPADEELVEADDPAERRPPPP